MSADPGPTRRLRVVPTPGDDGHDDGHWCSTSTTTLPGPTGEIVVFRVDGQLDLATLPAVAAALDRTLDRPLGHVIVGMAGLAFCAARGLDMFVDAGGRAAERGIAYSVSGASTNMRRLWSTLWPSRQPIHYPTVGSAVIAALSRRSGQAPGSSPTRLGPAPAPVADRPAHVEQLTDDQLTDRARAGDTEAYHTLVHRNCRRIYRIALHTPALSDDPDDPAHDMAVQLRHALAALRAADPD